MASSTAPEINVEKFHNSYPTGPDAAKKVLIGSYKNAFYVVNWAIWGVTLIACLSWYLWRRTKLSRAPVTCLYDDDKSTAPGKASTPRWRQSETQEATAVEVSSEELLQFRPLRDSIFGKICYWLCCLISLQFIALYIIFLVDFYNRCQVGSIDNLCFSGDHFLFGGYMTNGQTFFVVWCLSVIWFTGWVFNKGRVVNWFRVPCSLPEATHVHVWAPAAVEVVSSFVSPVVSAFRRLKAAMTPASHKGHFKTIEIVGGKPPGTKKKDADGAAATAAATTTNGNGVKPPNNNNSTSTPSIVEVNPLRISRESIGRRGSIDDLDGSIAASITAAAVTGSTKCASTNDDIPRRYFVFQGIRFIVDDLTGRVRRARLTVGTTTGDFHAVAAAGGLSHAEVARRRAVVGDNSCPFRPSTFGELVVDEWFTMFHVYQLVQYILWYWFSYLFVAVIMTVVVVLSGAVSMFLVHRAQLAIAEVANLYSVVSVRRENGDWVEVDSREIVPGDLVRLGPGAHVPCDLIVVSGTCVVDESSLTGESMPCVKSAAPTASTFYDVRQPIPKHTLFSGTTIRQAGSGAVDFEGSNKAKKSSKAENGGEGDTADGPNVLTASLSLTSSTRRANSKGREGAEGGEENATVTAVAVATGMDTSKGDLLSVILFPASMIFKYDEELTVVITMLLAYAAVCFALSIWFQNMAGNPSDWVTKWMYATAIVNQVLSPLLPVALEVGQIHSMERLKRHGINCLQPKRIMISGKIRVFCFDKTGTLTKEGLDFVGFQPPAPDGKTMGPVLAATDADKDHVVGLATCNNAEKVGETIVANEVEYKMFQATNWTFSSTDGASPVVLNCDQGKAHVVHQRNDFCHSRMTQSVVVEKPCGTHEIFVKGSFETVAGYCRPETLPSDYASVAKKHALAGSYVLALAKRTLAGKEGTPQRFPLDRDEMERDLTFQGLIIFRNELREDSAETIAKLKAGDIRVVMITGDSPQCGVHIARECGLTGKQTPIYLAEFDSKQGLVIWNEMGAEDEKCETNLTTDELLLKHEAKLKTGEVELAVTGSAFKILQLMGKAQDLLYYMRVFARVKPEGKIRVVDAFISSGVVVGMCGDGGNDCGALRSAHTGVALSEAEASMVSPFTSKVKSVAAVEELLREGRAALHTSIASYKFLITYGLLFSVLKLSCYYFGVIMCQAAYMLIEGIAIICLPYTMTLALPAKILREKRPTHGLLSAITMTSVLGLWFINTAFTTGALEYMSHARGYVRWPAKYAAGKDWWTLGDNWEATVLFFCTLFQFITSALVFSFGAGFTRNVARNWALMFVYGFLATVGVVLLLTSDNYFTFVFHIASQEFNDPTPTSPAWIAYQEAGGAPSPGMSFGFRLGLFFLILGNLACQALWQALVVNGPMAGVLARLYPSMRPKFRL